MSALYVLGQAKLGLSGEEPGLSVLSLLWQSRAGAGRTEAKEKGQRAVIPPWCWGWGRAWPGSLSTSGFLSRDGQEVAVVYYREGYVPQNYDQQVSTHLPAPETTSWALSREREIIPGAATLSGVGSVLPGVAESIGKL